MVIFNSYVKLPEGIPTGDSDFATIHSMLVFHAFLHQCEVKRRAEAETVVGPSRLSMGRSTGENWLGIDSLWLCQNSYWKWP